MEIKQIKLLIQTSKSVTKDRIHDYDYKNKVRALHAVNLSETVNTVI